MSVLRKWARRLPVFLIAVGLASATVALLHAPVETIGSRFPELPTGLPAPALPEISLARLQAVAPAAFTIAFLAGIEALLSAVVADGMIGSRHRSNQRSEEHTSELQSLMRHTYSVFCLKKKKNT